MSGTATVSEDKLPRFNVEKRSEWTRTEMKIVEETALNKQKQLQGSFVSH